MNSETTNLTQKSRVDNVKSGRGVKLTTHLHLVPRSRMRGAIPPLPHTPSWRGLPLWCNKWLCTDGTFSFHENVNYIYTITMGWVWTNTEAPYLRLGGIPKSSALYLIFYVLYVYLYLHNFCCLLYFILRIRVVNGGEKCRNKIVASHPASGGYKYRGLVLQGGGWAWG
jgi:hypothetical protein